MRRLAATLLALGALAPALRAQTIPVALGGQRSSIVGLPFSVPITVDMSARTDKLGAFAIRLTWNPAVLQLKGGADGTFGSVTVNQDSAAYGVVRMSGANPAGASGLVTVGAGTFVPLTADTTTLSLQLSELYAAGSFANLLPSAQVASGSVYCPARGRYGDINGDGNVNSADALIALTSVVGLPTGSYDVGLGDVNTSGTTTATDALIMLSYAVGMDVTAYRILQVAGGSCAAFATTTMAILPGSFTMLVGQQARLEARRADSTGALVVLTDLVWKSDKPAVVGMLTDGTAVARDTGTATIVALHGTTDSALAVIHVDSSRTVQLVDAQAVTAHVQLGSAAYPFGTIAQALMIARPGDTVEVKPGTYQEAVALDRDVRLIGDTLPGGGRPVIVNGVGDGVHLTGPGYREVRNFAFGTVNSAVNVDGPSSVLLAGLTGQGLPQGIVVTTGSPVIHLVGSHLSGTSAYTCCSAYGVDAPSGPLDSLVLDGTELSDFYASGVYAPYGGTFVVRHSHLHDFGGYAMELGGNSGPGVRVAVDSSVIQRSGYELLALADLVAGSITHSVLEAAPYQDIVHQYQENIPAGGFLALHGDSLVANNASWLYLSALDSVVVDSVRASIPQASGDFYNVGYLRITRSAFANTSSDAVYVDNYTTGGVLEVRNVSFTGDPRNDLSGYQVDAYNMRTTVDSSSFVNAYRAVQVGGDSGMAVTNSSFRHVEYPVTFDGNWSAGCTGTGCPVAAIGALVRHNTFAGYYTAADIEYGAASVDSNAFTGNNYSAIYVYQPSAVSVTFNQVAGDATPIYVDMFDSSVTARITDNTLSGITSKGVDAYGPSTPDSAHGRFDIRRNQIACAPAVSGTKAVSVQYADALIGANQLTDCSYGVFLYSSTATSRADSVVGNVVQGPVGLGYGGIVAQANLRTWILGNTVTMDTTGSSYDGPIYIDASSYNAGTAAYVDSNAVNGGLYYGLSVFNVDTAGITRNTVQGTKNGSSYGAITVGGTISTSGRVYGNIVRHAAGQGIQVYNYGFDTILVDSNMVSHAALEGVFATSAGVAHITRNTLDSNATGIHVSNGLLPVIDSNNIFGNGFGLQADGPSVTAQNNWWGDPLGPSCNPQFGCTTSTGDSVSTGYPVAWSPPLLAPNGSAPPPSAPRVFLAAARLAAPSATPLLLPAPDAMPARQGGASFAPAAPTRASAIRTVPAGASPAVARLLEQGTERRAALLARRARLADQAAARMAEHAARMQQRAQNRVVHPSTVSGPASGPAERRP